jgi:hypothetical protein
MQKIFRGLAVAMLGAFMALNVALAADDAIGTLARITMSLNHYPSDADKEELNAIIESDETTDEEVTIALAILNMQHTVGAGDAQRLDQLVADDMVEESVKTLAGILLHLNHTPSDEDKALLSALLDE